MRRASCDEIRGLNRLKSCHADLYQWKHQQTNCLYKASITIDPNFKVAIEADAKTDIGRRGIGKGAPAPAPRLRDPLQDQTPAAGRRRPALPRAFPAVPSALGGLTSGFGMGPGVPPLPRSPACAGRSGSCKSLGARALRAAQRGAQDRSPARSLPGPSGPWGKKSSTD